MALETGEDEWRSELRRELCLLSAMGKDLSGMSEEYQVESIVFLLGLGRAKQNLLNGAHHKCGVAA